MGQPDGGRRVDHMRCRCLMASFALAALASAVAAREARAESPVELVIHDGLVWLVSHDATTQAILTEWARVGQTTLIDADRAPDTRVTGERRGVGDRSRSRCATGSCPRRATLSMVEGASPHDPSRGFTAAT